MTANSKSTNMSTFIVRLWSKLVSNLVTAVTEKAKSCKQLNLLQLKTNVAVDLKKQPTFDRAHFKDKKDGVVC